MLGNCTTDNGCLIISSNDRMQQPQTHKEYRPNGNFEILGQHHIVLSNKMGNYFCAKSGVLTALLLKIKVF